MPKVNRVYEWIQFYGSYLAIAYLGCQELEDKKYKTPDNKEYEIEDLIIPVYFNLKHGIEIYIKTLHLVLDDKYDQGHDIKILFSKLKTKIDNNKPNIKETTAPNNYIVTKDDVEKFPEYLNEIEDSINYFYEVGLLQKKIKDNFLIYDEMNDIFRYPENKATIDIEWPAILKRFNSQDILEIKEQVKNLWALCNITGYILSVCSQNSITI